MKTTKPKKSAPKKSTAKLPVKKVIAKSLPKKTATATKPKVKDTFQSLALEAAQLAYDTKAQDIMVLDLTQLPSFTDYFVICSGTSDRQVQAICDRIHRALKLKDQYPLGIEGFDKGHWILMDYGPVVVHIFYAETREHYAIERFWGDAPQLKLKLK